jgi:hypothetical protein
MGAPPQFIHELESKCLSTSIVFPKGERFSEHCTVRGFFFVNREECLRKQLEKALEEAVSKKDHNIHELKAQMAMIEHEWENCFAKRVAQEVEQKENELRTRSRANKSEVLQSDPASPGFSFLHILVCKEVLKIIRKHVLHDHNVLDHLVCQSQQLCY